nr:MAG TPA: hypothetical protein [Caudoviricetes sp.]
MTHHPHWQGRTPHVPYFFIFLLAPYFFKNH